MKPFLFTKAGSWNKHTRRVSMQIPKGYGIDDVARLVEESGFETVDIHGYITGTREETDEEFALRTEKQMESERAHRAFIKKRHAEIVAAEKEEKK